MEEAPAAGRGATAAATAAAIGAVQTVVPTPPPRTYVRDPPPSAALRLARTSRRKVTWILSDKVTASIPTNFAHKRRQECAQAGALRTTQELPRPWKQPFHTWNRLTTKPLSAYCNRCHMYRQRRTKSSYVFRLQRLSPLRSADGVLQAGKNRASTKDQPASPASGGHKHTRTHVVSPPPHKPATRLWLSDEVRQATAGGAKTRVG